MSDPFFELGEGAQDEAPDPQVSYLGALNEEQRRSVETLDGPVLVLAGAGTGKTRVLTTRLAHLLLTRRAWPSQVLAVTFTNKAAAEMRERVSHLLGRPAEDLWLGTFHAIGARFLRRHAELAGLRPDFTILDSDDQQRLIKQILQAEDIDDHKFPPRILLSIIQRWKDRGLTPDTVPPAEDSDFADGRALEIYRIYQDRLKVLNAADFGDLLLHCLSVLTSFPDVLAEWQQRFKYILVDEYQDTNVAQYLWLRLLAQRHRNLCCVGDDDQSIYSWRGAEITNILKFERDFPGARIIRLERNYRSTSHILAAASALIAHNEGRLGKTLWTEGEDGERVRVHGLWDGEAEARWICDEIEMQARRDGGYSGMAILVRAGFQTREFEERLITLGIPYRVVGGPRFYERQEIRDAIAYFRVAAQPDDSLAFERIVNLPKRGLGDVTLQVIHKLSRAQNISLVESVRRLVETDELTPKARATLARLLQDFDRWRRVIAALPPAEAVETILDESGYTAMWRDDRSVEAPGRLENLKELVAALEEFESLQAFLEHVSLVMENDAAGGTDRVGIMTLHGAKGLEFDTVFLPGWEEGVFPHQRALDESGLKGLEEERRLAYVGLTRARKRAVITFAANRRVYNSWQNSLPSRFIEELPEEHSERTAETGLMRTPPRAQEYGAFSGPLIEGRAIELPAGRFAPGGRVFHQKFGYGRIVGVEGNKLDIDFDKAGSKKVMDSFVEPA